MGKTVRAGGDSTVTASSSILARAPHAANDFGVRGPLAPGTRIGRYEVIELLGEGSMGSVYRARNPELARDVALKRINPGAVSIAAAEDRLRREARAMARVEHDAVVRIYDTEVVDGELFVAMELARGGTLAAWIATQRRGWREVMRAFIAAGRGLAAAHHAGLVHRDVKPSNILIDAHGRPKISDFGLARAFDDDEAARHDGETAANGDAALDARITRTGAIVGTLAYIAPEQLAGDAIDARADQFAFCVALWEALCGRRPFDVAHDSAPTRAMMLRAISTEPRADTSGGVRTPRRVLALVRRGLAANRSQRWRSMDELLDALDRAARPGRVWWLAAAAAIGIVVAIVVAAAQAGRAPPPVCGKRDQVAALWNPGVRDRYVSDAQDPAAAQEDARWFDGYARMLEAQYAASCGHAEDGRMACLDSATEDLRSAVARSEREYWPRLRAIDRCGAGSREIDLGSISSGERVRLSLDGRKLLFASAGHAPVIRERGRSEGQPVDLAVPLKWLPDHTIVGFNGAGRFETWPATSSTMRRLPAPGPVIDASSELRRVAFDAEDAARSVIDVSIDLGHIAMIVDGKLAILPVAGGAPIAEPIPASDVIFVAGSFSPDNRRFASVIGNTIYIDNLVSRHREVLAFRLSQERSPNASTSVRWLDPTSFVVFGGASNAYGGDLWRLRVDDADRVVAPPQVLLRNERDTSLLVHDAQPGRLLFERAGLAARDLLIDGDSAVTLPGSLAPLLMTSADRAHHRVLVKVGDDSRRWAWMSLDGTSVEPISALDGLSMAQLGPIGLMALDLRSDPPRFVAFDDAGTELARTALPAPRGAGPMLRCGASRCMVKWSEGAVAVTAAIDGQTLHAPVRHDPSHLTGARVYWDLSPDGSQIATVTAPISSALMLVDLGGSGARRVTSETCGRVEGMRYLPDGSLALICVRLRSGAVEAVLVRRDIAGHERVLWQGDASIVAVAPLDDQRMVVCIYSFQHQLALLEDP